MKHILSTIIFALGMSSMLFSQHTLPELPYKYNALEPYIDSSTMFIHHKNHHAAYVNNLNKSLEKYPELQKKNIVELMAMLDQIPADIQTSVRNNGGGHFNHTLFWNLMTPANKSRMSKKVEKALVESFGSIDNFKSEFEKAALTRFGSGWAWLIRNEKGELQITSTANQDNPIMNNAAVKGKPILAVDVWEHAYYLKYQSKRGEYLKSFWAVVNWKEVEKLMFK